MEFFDMFVKVKAFINLDKIDKSRLRRYNTHDH